MCSFPNQYSSFRLVVDNTMFEAGMFTQLFSLELVSDKIAGKNGNRRKMMQLCFARFYLELDVLWTVNCSPPQSNKRLHTLCVRSKITPIRVWLYC